LTIGFVELLEFIEFIGFTSVRGGRLEAINNTVSSRQ
jgi:hypothetical protein